MSAEALVNIVAPHQFIDCIYKLYAPKPAAAVGIIRFHRKRWIYGTH
ncbi:MAG TPA: hypothetical protein VFJ58_10465 [Armatimonadota bacterium]|nr:hypothetical protein [Armatimonadota bacterium]